MGHQRAVWPELLTGYPPAADPPPAPVFSPGLQPRMLACVAYIKELPGPLASCWVQQRTGQWEGKEARAFILPDPFPQDVPGAGHGSLIADFSTQLSPCGSHSLLCPIIL